MTDLEPVIGQYALRTFKIEAKVCPTCGHHPTTRRLKAVVKNVYWPGGVCEAECLASKKCPNPPGDGCTCGVYGALTLSKLRGQYPESRDVVAVIAAEGETIIGDTGLRTAAARIVAHWCRHDDAAEVFAEQAPESIRHPGIIDMIAKYGLPCDHATSILIGAYQVNDKAIAKLSICSDCGAETTHSPTPILTYPHQHLTLEELRTTSAYDQAVKAYRPFAKGGPIYGGAGGAAGLVIGAGGTGVTGIMQQLNTSLNAITQIEARAIEGLPTPPEQPKP